MQCLPVYIRKIHMQSVCAALGLVFKLRPSKGSSSPPGRAIRPLLGGLSGRQYETLVSGLSGEIQQGLAGKTFG